MDQLSPFMVVNWLEDHRMAMSAAVAAVCLDEPTTLVNAECVSKSYPRFFEDLKSVGGNVDVLSV